MRYPPTSDPIRGSPAAPSVTRAGYPAAGRRYSISNIWRIVAAPAQPSWLGSLCEHRPVSDIAITVPERLQRPHRLVAAARDTFAGAKPDEAGLRNVRPRAGVIYLRVSRQQLRRALLILAAILTEAERRGYEAVDDKGGYGDKPGVGLRLRGHVYNVSITEMTDRIALTDVEIDRSKQQNRSRLSWTRPPTHRSLANGRLRLALPTRYDGARCNWADGTRGALETKLASFFVELERRADDDVKRDEERARLEEERRRAADERVERERLAAVEQARVERLREEIEAWRLTRAARAYVRALRGHLPDLNDDDTARVAAWCDWVDEWCDRSDPVQNLAPAVGRSTPKS